MRNLTESEYENMGFISKRQYFRNKKYKDSIVIENAEIGRNVKIFPHVYIGENVVIGDNSIIQYGAFIEQNCRIGRNSRIGTNAVLRKETNIGDYSIFGSLSASEGKNWFGNNVLIHTQCHLTLGLIVEDWVFFGPMVGTANDHDMVHGRRYIKPFVPQGPHIKFGARVGSQSFINPGMTVGREAVIGSCALVTKDVPDYAVAYGVPAKVRRQIDVKWRLSEEKYKKFRSRVSEEDLKKIMDEMSFHKGLK